MLGMEKMLASLIGMEPEEMAAKVKEVETVFTTLADGMTKLADRQEAIALRMETVIESQNSILIAVEGLKNASAGNRKRNAPSSD